MMSKNPEVGIRRIPAYTPNTPLALSRHAPNHRPLHLLAFSFAPEARP